MKATIYIRRENEDAWNAIEDKSAWVNECLKKGNFISALVDHSKPNHGTPGDMKNITYKQTDHWGA